MNVTAATAFVREDGVVLESAARRALEIVLPNS
jgi:hypothetical protein